MNKFTIIRQKLSLIFIIITFIIAGLVFLNCVYNSLFVWYDNDNDVNLTDGIIPVSSMFGYKILSNSYVVNGTCTKYNNDIILTTNINTISFKIFKMIFTLYFMIMIFTYFSQIITGEWEVIEANPFDNTSFSEFKGIIRLGIFSVFALSIISNNYNNPGDNEYKQYNDIEETFESYLFAQYIKIDPDDKVTLTKIIKNTNKSNFNNKDDYTRIKSATFKKKESKDICLKFLELCKDLCEINKDTNVDVVKTFHKFLLNCKISFNFENIDKYKRYNIIKVADEDITVDNKANAIDTTISEEKNNESRANIRALIADDTKRALLKFDDNDYIKGKKEDGSDVYYQIKRYIEPEPSWTEKLWQNYIIKNIKYFFTDIGCVFNELSFLQTNFNSIFELLYNINPFRGDDTRKYNTNVEEKSGMNIVLLTSLLTKDFLKKCEDEKRLLHKNYGEYLQKMGEYAIDGIDDNKSFIRLMNEAKKATYRDLFIIKGLVTGIIVFSFANIVLKIYYNIYHTEFLKSIDKNIVLYKIYGDLFNVFKYETIRRLLNEDDYLYNVLISLLIIGILFKLWGYPKDIVLKC